MVETARKVRGYSLDIKEDKGWIYHFRGAGATGKQ